MKKLLSVILAVAMLAALCTVPAFAAVSNATLTATLVEEVVSGDVVYAVSVKNDSKIDKGFLSGSFQFTYDSSVLEPITTDEAIQELTEGAIEVASAGVTNVSYTPNFEVPGQVVVSFAAATVKTVFQNKDLFKCYFKVKSGLKGVKTFKFAWVGDSVVYSDTNETVTDLTYVNSEDVVYDTGVADEPTKVETEAKNFASDVVATDTVIGGQTIPAGSKTLLSYSKKAALTGKTWAESGAVLSLSGATDVTLETADCVGPALHFVGDAYGIIFTGTAIKAGSTYVVRTYTKFTDGTVLYSDAKTFAE